MPSADSLLEEGSQKIMSIIIKDFLILSFLIYLLSYFLVPEKKIILAVFALFFLSLVQLRLYSLNRNQEEHFFLSVRHSNKNLYGFTLYLQ